jgi:hypothetical protein
MSRKSSPVPLDVCLPVLIFVLGAGHACVSCAAAQQLTIPENPGASEPWAHSATPPVIVEPAARSEAPVHHFWDRTNIFLFSGVSLFRGLDYASTRNMQARGREEVLLPDDVVNNSAGFAGLEAAASATSVGLSYWMHRTGHHKLERWVSIAHISVTGFGAARNYALKSKHPPAVR